MTLRVRVRPRRRIVAGALVGALALLATGAALAEAYPRPGTTERVSVDSDGAEGNDPSGDLAMSADGRYVAFGSRASNLVPGDTNGTWDIFVHDRETGVTERVSVASDGTEGDATVRTHPAISADGRHVAFASDASNLVPGDTNEAPDVFVHDRETGVTERVSVASDGTEGDSWSVAPAISADGRHVAFESFASNLVAGDTNGTWDIFVHDRQTGVTERVSVASDGTEGDEGSAVSAISADGRNVAFHSVASNLVPGDTNGTGDVFVHDRETGTTERVSVASDGTEGNGFSGGAAISVDGRHVSFQSVASNLVPGDTNEAPDIFVHDRETGTTERVSVASDGTEGNDDVSLSSTISADGRYVAFHSAASNLVPGDSNGEWDTFVHDRQAGVTEQVSVASDGTRGNGPFRPLSYPVVSADGRHVAFQSFASNLVPGDTNDAWDVFVRDRGPAIGVGSLQAQRVDDELSVSGWATFSGVTVASADDPGDDGVEALGAEITRASVTYRPEQDDLLLRLRLVSLPHAQARVPVAVSGGAVHTHAGAPGVVYRWFFTVGETAYEVRALRAAARPPTTAPSFALYECEAGCTEITRLAGGIGTTGAEVRVAVPLEALGVEEGAELTAVEAAVALGDASAGVFQTLDDVALDDAMIPVPRVELGVAPVPTPADQVVFADTAVVQHGAFSSTVNAPAAAGSHHLWARACLGETCAVEQIPVPDETSTITPTPSPPATQETRYFLRSPTRLGNADLLAGANTFSSGDAPTFTEPALWQDIPEAGNDEPDAPWDPNWQGTLDQPFDRFTIDFWQKAPVGEFLFGRAQYDVTIWVGTGAGATRYDLPAFAAELGAFGPDPRRVTHSFTTMFECTAPDVRCSRGPDAVEEVPLDIDPGDEPVTVSISGRSAESQASATIVYDSVLHPSGFVVKLR